MTDEEKLAEEYVNNKWTPFRFYDAGCDVYNDDIREDVKQAFLAGLKAGKDMAETDLATVAYMQGAERYKPKWHKVADGDLPKYDVLGDSVSITVLNQNGNKVFYNFFEKVWKLESNNKISKVISWCEIPKE